MVTEAHKMVWSYSLLKSAGVVNLMTRIIKDYVMVTGEREREQEYMCLYVYVCVNV